MKREKEIVILYSGGTDSTCAAAITAENFDVIHLLTYKRFGFFSVDNTSVNVKKLKDKYDSKKFLHKVIDVDKLARYICTRDYFLNILKFGFFAVSGCVLCPLIHHIRTLVYCLDNCIVNVADGVTRELPFFPSHMEKIIEEFKKMYAAFGIVYHTPVYDFDVPSSPSLLDKIDSIRRTYSDESSLLHKKMTTGRLLYELGFIPLEDIKGSEPDRKMQFHCYQFILHNIFIHWYYILWYSYSDYEKLSLSFFRNKLSHFIDLLKGYPKNQKINSLIKSLCQA